MKRHYIFFSVIAVLFIVFFNCQQTGGSGGGGGGGDNTPSKWISESKITAPDAADSDLFGYSVSISGSISGDYIVVGAYSEDGAGTNRGAVYIYHRTGANTWDAGFKITAIDTQDNDEFGYSVSISGDYAIVGAPYEDGGGTDRGAAYIYHRTGENIWGEEKKLKASDTEDDDWFGWSVSISGNYAIVGAREEDGIGSNRGAAYIYQLSGGTEAKITASDPNDGDRFGNSVSISGDYIIVGAHGEDGGGINRGAAYIYQRTGENTWGEEKKIIASDAADNDEFGYSVSISGDYVIVGIPSEEGVGGNDRGAAYIFHMTGLNIWDSGTKITASDAADEDYFGYSVSISGKYAIVGAYYEDGSGENQGAAYIFQRIGINNWNSGTKITASDAQDFCCFGNSVSISGDFIVIGAYCNDGTSSNMGAAYIIK